MAKRLTSNEALIEAMSEEMRRDERIFVLGEEIVGHQGIQAYQAYTGMEKEFPERMVDVTMSELVIIGSCIGAAMTGMRPICDILFSEFLALIMGHLAVDAGSAYYFSAGTLTVPMVVRARYGVGVTRGHPGDYHAWLQHIPGVKVVAPSNAYDAKGLMKSAIRDDNPVVYLDHLAICTGKRSEIPEEEYFVPIGVADVKRPGKDVTVVGFGNMVNHALTAAEELSKESIDVEVVDLRTVVPFDREAIRESVRKTGVLVIAQETWKQGSTGSEIAAFVSEELFHELKAPIIRLGMPHVPFARSLDLMKLLAPSPQNVIEGVRAALAAGSKYAQAG